MVERHENTFGSPGLRLVQLYVLLCSTGRAYTLSRFASLFRCSRQTVLRMTEQLQRVPDAELEAWVQKKERLFRIASSPAPESLHLTPDALRHLALCSTIVRHLLPDPFQHEMRETLHALGESIGVSEDSENARARPWVKGRIDYTRFESMLRDAQIALHGRRLCQIEYQSRAAERRKPYLIAPLQIIAFREALYLRCQVYDAPTRPTEIFHTLAIHRVKRLALQTSQFIAAPDADPDPYFGFPFHEPTRVRVAFRGGAATYVGERTWSGDQKLTRRRDGSLLLDFTTTSRLEVIAWVLGFGPDAELIKPPDLRRELHEQALAIAARYREEEAT